MGSTRRLEPQILTTANMTTAICSGALATYFKPFKRRLLIVIGLVIVFAAMAAHPDP